MINETISHIVSNWARPGKVGVLCSIGTVKSEIYEHSAQRLGVKLDFTYPSERLQGRIGDGIFAVKAGITYKDSAAGREFFMPAMDELINNGAELIILGCTEIPLAITFSRYKNVPIVDTIAILASACIDRCRA
jgi:aspartate racemase